MASTSLRHVPHQALSAYVDPYVGYHHTGPPARHRGMPSGRLTVIIAFDAPLDLAWLGDEAGRAQHWMLASGMHTRAVDIRHQGLQHGIQLALTPAGSRALFGVPASALARALVPLADVLGLEDYESVAAATWPERFAAVDRALLAALDRHRVAAPRAEVAHAWDLVERSGGTLRVGAIAEAVGWSRRHLATQFRAETGLGVKEAARICRFDRSRLLVGRGRSPADAAAACGYADQPHLNREWRALCGYTPAEYLRAEFPFLQDADVAAG